MNMKNAILVLIAIALVAVLWAAFARGASEPTCLVPAWQLTPEGRYDGQTLVDPVASWSPDSRSLLFAAVSAKGYRSSILRWKVGEKRADRVLYGVSPNYTDNNTFIYLQQGPKSVIERSLSADIGRLIAPGLAKVDVWREVTGFSYNPARKTIELRLSSLTQFYEPGFEEFDLTGKSLGSVPRTTGGGILARGADPKGSRSAVIFGDEPEGTRELRIAAPGEESKSKPVASGSLGAVAWSPDGRLVAFADAAEVKVLNPSDMKIITVARFSSPPESGDQAFVCRLLWSPNGSYLAALDIVPSADSSSSVLYVLDMTKIKW